MIKNERWKQKRQKREAACCAERRTWGLVHKTNQKKTKNRISKKKKKKHLWRLCWIGLMWHFGTIEGWVISEGGYQDVTCRPPAACPGLISHRHHQSYFNPFTPTITHTLIGGSKDELNVHILCKISSAWKRTETAQSELDEVRLNCCVVVVFRQKLLMRLSSWCALES